MSNYNAVVCRIQNLRPHSNADRLVCTSIFGNNIIVGKDTQIGDLGLYFPLESQLGVEFASKNDLIRRKDVEGKPAGGMFEESTRRVRCQKFRGEKSEGFFIPISCLDYMMTDAATHFKEGDELGVWMDKEISTKYIPKRNPTTQAGKRKERKPRESKIIPGQFHFHFDTAQLGRNLHKIQPDDVIVISWKIHGASFISSNCLVKKKLNPLLKLLRSFGLPIKDTHYEFVAASRRVIKSEFQDAKDHYYGEDLWTDVGKEHFDGLLKTGETLYGEVVGFTRSGKAIQGSYDYGCDPTDFDNLSVNPQHKVFIYRITMTASDGTVTELQWNQVKERCNQLGVPTVPEIYYGKARGVVKFYEGPPYSGDLDEWQQLFLHLLKEKYVHDQNSIFCKNVVPEEGITLRLDKSEIEVFKLKNSAFLMHETKQLDEGIVDLETEQDGASVV